MQHILGAFVADRLNLLSGTVGSGYVIIFSGFEISCKLLKRLIPGILDSLYNPAMIY